MKIQFKDNHTCQTQQQSIGVEGELLVLAAHNRKRSEKAAKARLGIK